MYVIEIESQQKYVRLRTKDCLERKVSCVEFDVSYVDFNVSKCIDLFLNRSSVDETSLRLFLCILVQTNDRTILPSNNIILGKFP